jgi:hypothetical protein
MDKKNTETIKAISAVVSILAVFLSVLLSPLVLDIDTGAMVAILGFAIFGTLFIWFSLPSPAWTKILLTLVVLVVAFGSGYWVSISSRPSFEISALNTLEGDKNAYELTDYLIWGADDAAIKHGLPITFTFEITPHYFGKQRYGRILAVISGEEGARLLEKPLWNTFSSDSTPVRLNLTLAELVKASGIGVNSDPLANPLGSEEPPFRQARLLIKIAEEANKANPLDEEAITIRNGPWDFRSNLVWREGKRQVDVWLKNLGGPGDYTVAYHLMHQDRSVGSSTYPMWNGTTEVKYWNEPAKLFHLERGRSITDTVSLPEGLSPGRYIVEATPVKKMPYITFSDREAKWEDIRSLPMDWWYSDPSKVDRDVFVESILVDDKSVIGAERQRLLNQEGIDLGLALEPAKEITSAAGIKGLHQAFQAGEIFVHGEKAYALYGPILAHYRELLSGPMKDAAGRALDVPISSVQTVTSTNGTLGTLVQFEHTNPALPPSAIYASSKGVAAVWGAIAELYHTRGEHTGWLGFPLSDEQYFSDGTTQMFESGYAVYYYPKTPDNQRDWGRPVMAYPYLASRGSLFDVSAKQGWQNTGIRLQPDDRVSIVQVGGAWSTLLDGKTFDAGGNPSRIQNQQRELPSAPEGSLIGKIDEAGDNIFSVGRWGAIESPIAGTLYLAMNDGDYSDNNGFITVQIMVNPPE